MTETSITFPLSTIGCSTRWSAGARQSAFRSCVDPCWCRVGVSIERGDVVLGRRVCWVFWTFEHSCVGVESVSGAHYPRAVGSGNVYRLVYLAALHFTDKCMISRSDDPTGVNEVEHARLALTIRLFSDVRSWVGETRSMRTRPAGGRVGSVAEGLISPTPAPQCMREEWHGRASRCISTSSR